MYDTDCWRDGQIKQDEFLSDVELFNKFIDIQSSKNPDFLIEVFLEPKVDTSLDTDSIMSGTVNMVIAKSNNYGGESKHQVSDVLSLNTSMTMSGFCLANDKARMNTNFYNDIAISNRMGSWGFMDKAITELWWITPTGWDGINEKTKEVYVENYMQYRDNGESYE